MPLAAAAKPSGSYSLIVDEPGDQTDPSIDQQYVVYASSTATSGSWDVLRYRIGDPPGSAQIVAGGPGDQDQPEVNFTNVVYRGPEGIWITNWNDRDHPLRTPPGPGEISACPFGVAVSSPAIGARVAAWECGVGPSRDISVFVLGSREEYLLTRPGASDADGDQHSPAAFGDYVAFVDEADGGSVWLHDSSVADPEGSTTLVCPGRATGVAIGDLMGTVLAVARASSGDDADIEIWEPSGLVTALRVPGVQQNPHLSGDWVAFEDLTTGRSQVVLWNWISGIVFIPHPSTTNQTLNDVSTTRGVVVSVAFADDGDGTGVTHDIALYRLAIDAVPIPDDGSGESGWPWPPPPARRPPPASCDDPDPVVLATLVLGRDTGRPRAASLELAATPFPGDAVLPVLVCIDADRVSSAWVAFDDQVVAMPGDLDPHVARLQIPAVAENGEARISGVLAGKPGSSLVARVLADPGRIQVAADGVPLGLRSVPPRALSLSGGCGTAGGAGWLAVLAVLAALRRQRRR